MSNTIFIKKTMITIVMAEDHQILIDGVKSFFEYDDNINIIGSVNNGEELVKLVSLKQPKLVITDIRMPIMDGVNATKIITKSFPNIPVLALTMFDQSADVYEMLEAGARGYVTKEVNQTESIGPVIFTIIHRD